LKKIVIDFMSLMTGQRRMKPKTQQAIPNSSTRRFYTLLALLSIGSFAHADTYTNRLNLTLPTCGSPNWCNAINGNFQIIDATSTGGGGGGDSYIRTGYSGRFSQAVNVTLASQALDQIFAFQYTAPALTLGTSPGASVKELGTTMTNITLSAYTVEKSSPITIVQWKLNGTVIKSSSTPTSTGGTEVYIDTNTRSTTSAYTAVAGDGTTNTTSNSATFTFVYPFYYGVGAQALSFASVQGLTKLVQTPANTATTTSPAAQVYYFAYPQSAGNLTSILDPNGFETISGYTKRSGTMTMLDSTVQNYYVYEFNTPTTQTNFTNTYKF
jgi:hypothetical protein